MAFSKINITPTPPAWVALERDSDGNEWLAAIGGSEVEARKKGKREMLGDDKKKLRVVPDSPDLEFKLSPWFPDSPLDLTMREIWFERHQRALKPLAKKPTQAHVMTFEPGTLKDPRGTYRASPQGPAPLPEDEEWPDCDGCDEPMSFLGTLDFREPPKGLEAPDGTLIAFACDDCEESNELMWLYSDEDFELHGSKRKKVEVATHWVTTEFTRPNKLSKVAEKFWHDEGAYNLLSCTWGTKIGGGYAPLQPNSDLLAQYTYLGQTPITGSLDGIAYFFIDQTDEQTFMFTQII